MCEKIVTKSIQSNYNRKLDQCQIIGQFYYFFKILYYFEFCI